MNEFGGLFEDLTINDEVGRVARRKAIAVANKRVDDRFGDFIRAASSPEEAAERFDLIKSDLENSVKEACAEFDVDHRPVLAGILDELNPAGDGLMGNALNQINPTGDGLMGQLNPFNNQGPKPPKVNFTPDAAKWFDEQQKQQKMEDIRNVINDFVRGGSTKKEARRPKMCPYHNELVNASLQVGEPQYAAFSGLVGGDAHCGGAFEGRCNFKPAMVTQDYWDRKETERAERKQQRELEREQENSFEMEAPHPDEAYDEADNSISDQANLSDLDNAPSAVGEGLSDSSESFSGAESAEPVLARAAGCGCDEGKMCDEGECEKCDAKRQVTAASDCQCWDGYERVPGTKPCAEGSCRKCDDHRKKASWSVTAVSDGDSWQKNDKVTQPAGPSPKMDKSVWKSLEDIDTDAGPYKTRQQDVLSGPDYSKSDSHGQATSEAVLEQTKAVTTQETLPTATNDSDAGFNTDKNIEGHHTDTFGNDGQAKPVTSEVLAAQRAETLDYSPNQKEAFDAESIGNVVDGLSGALSPVSLGKGIGEGLGNAAGEFVKGLGQKGDQVDELTGLPTEAIGSLSPDAYASEVVRNSPIGELSPEGIKKYLQGMQGDGMQTLPYDPSNPGSMQTLPYDPSNPGSMQTLPYNQPQNNYSIDSFIRGQNGMPPAAQYPQKDPFYGDPGIIDGQTPAKVPGLPYSIPQSYAQGMPPAVRMPNVEFGSPNTTYSHTSAAHKVTESDGKFYVTEDGGEKAAGPFDTEAEAKERAKEINNLENLERE